VAIRGGGTRRRWYLGNVYAARRLESIFRFPAPAQIGSVTERFFLFVLARQRGFLLIGRRNINKMGPSIHKNLR
jgi:hypothetical protein